MMLTWVLAVVVTSALAALFYFTWRMTRPAKVNFAPEWVAEFSPARYRPMERLLSEDDFQFLTEKSGLDRRLIERLKAQRRAVFRAYLSQMSRDFSRLQAIGKLMVLYSPHDRPDLAEALLRQELQFRRAWVTMHVRLVLHSFGVGRLEVGSLIQPIQQLTGFIQVPQGVGA